ncbi:MAG: hypothetical protein ACREO5_02670, partial [Candidatus Binatia bacterium]
MKTIIADTGRYLMMISHVLPGLLFFIIWTKPALAIVEFPIGYSSRGGAYAFIALVDQRQLLEREGIRATFVY